MTKSAVTPVRGFTATLMKNHTTAPIAASATIALIAPGGRALVRYETTMPIKTSAIAAPAAALEISFRLALARIATSTVAVHARRNRTECSGSCGSFARRIASISFTARSRLLMRPVRGR